MILVNQITQENNGVKNTRNICVNLLFYWLKNFLKEFITCHKEYFRPT